MRGPLAALKSGLVPTEAPRNLIDFVNGFRHKLFRAGLLAREKLEQGLSKMKVSEKVLACHSRSKEVVSAVLREPVEAI